MSTSADLILTEVGGLCVYVDGQPVSRTLPVGTKITYPDQATVDLQRIKEQAGLRSDRVLGIERPYEDGWIVRVLVTEDDLEQ